MGQAPKKGMRYILVIQYPKIKRLPQEWQYPSDVPRRLLPSIFAADNPMINKHPIRGYSAKIMAYERPDFLSWSVDHAMNRKSFGGVVTNRFDAEQEIEQLLDLLIELSKLYMNGLQYSKIRVPDPLSFVKYEIGEMYEWARDIERRSINHKLGYDEKDKIPPKKQPGQKKYTSGSRARQEWARIEMILQDIRLRQAANDPVFLSLPYMNMHAAWQIASYLLQYSEDALSQPMFIRQITEMQKLSDPKEILKIFRDIDIIMKIEYELTRYGTPFRKMPIAQDFLKTEAWLSVKDFYQLIGWVRNSKNLNKFPEEQMSENLRAIIQKEDPDRSNISETLRRHCINKGDVQNELTSTDENIKINTSFKDKDMNKLGSRIEWHIHILGQEISRLLKQKEFQSIQDTLSKAILATKDILDIIARNKINVSSLLLKDTWEIKKYGFISPPVQHPVQSDCFLIEYYIDDSSDYPQFYSGETGGWVNAIPQGFDEHGEIAYDLSGGSPYLGQQGNCCVLGNSVTDGMKIIGDMILKPVA